MLGLHCTVTVTAHCIRPCFPYSYFIPRRCREVAAAVEAAVEVAAVEAAAAVAEGGSVDDDPLHLLLGLLLLPLRLRRRNIRGF